jgi:hypothetical protein
MNQLGLWSISEMMTNKCRVIAFATLISCSFRLMLVNRVAKWFSVPSEGIKITLPLQESGHLLHITSCY